MKNNILKIINEKYEKYSIGYSKIECSKSEHFGVRHSDWKSCLIKLVLEFIFRALPHIFRAKSIQPPSKKWPVRGTPTVVKRQLTICFKSSKPVQICLCMLMSLSIHLHGLHLDAQYGQTWHLSTQLRSGDRTGRRLLCSTTLLLPTLDLARSPSCDWPRSSPDQIRWITLCTRALLLCILYYFCILSHGVINDDNKRRLASPW